MKKTMKVLAGSTLISIGIAMTIFCVVGIILDVTNGGSFRLEHYRFTKMVVGCFVVGIGYGAPAVVYREERLPLTIRAIIHMGIGCVVYTIVAYAVGWIYGPATMGQGIAIAAAQLGVAFLIWLIFMRFHRREVKRMNEKIQSKKS